MPLVPLASAQRPLVLVLDMGTSSLRALVFDARARQVDTLAARRTYHARAEQDGESTLSPAELFDALVAVLDEIVARLAGQTEIAAVAATSLAYNVLGVDPDGLPLTPAYLYSDTRNAQAVEQLRAAHDWQPIYARTGCPLHTGYLVPRLVWLRETEPERFQRAAQWLSLYEYFMRRLFGRARLSHSFASWSGMLNQAALDWDPALLDLAGVRRDQLSAPEAADCSLTGLVSEFAARWQPLAHIPWYPALGDGAMANVGSGCLDATRVAVTVGTSGAMRAVMPAVQGMHTLPRGLWMYRVDEKDGLMGGSLNNGGNAFAYLSQLLRLPDASARESELERLPPDGHGLTILPFFAGERSPGYRGDARAAVTGWSLGTTAVELWQATLEAIAYRFAAVYELLRAAIPAPREVIASGAALLHSKAWVQILADVLGVPVTLSGETEATARGAALVALRALGVIQSLADLPAEPGARSTPNPANVEVYRRARERQKTLYDAVLG